MKTTHPCPSQEGNEEKQPTQIWDASEKKMKYFQIKLTIGTIIFVLIFAFACVLFFLGFVKEVNSKEAIAEEKLQGTLIEIVESPAGFDVYVRDSLVFEFMPQNCDSNTLETLEMLFNAEKELRSQTK